MLLKDRVRRRFPFFFLCSRTGCEHRVSQQSILKSQAGNYHQAGPEITAIPIWLHAIAFQQRRAQIQTPAGLSLEVAAQLTVYYVLLKLTQPKAAHTEDRRVWKAALFPFFFIEFTQGIFRPACATERSGPSAIGQHYYVDLSLSHFSVYATLSQPLYNQVKLCLWVLFTSQVDTHSGHSPCLCRAQLTLAWGALG